MDTPKDGDNAWPNRKEMVKGLIRFHDFDIFGTQEGFKHQLDNILELGNYAYIGAGRDDGKEAGEHSAIFYKKDRFEVLDKGNFWFSETPDVPGKGWDAVCCNRICSWGKFKDKISGQVFFFFNSHYDHQGKVARRESSHLLLKKIREIAGEKAIVFATGDFNAVPTNRSLRWLPTDCCWIHIPVQKRPDMVQKAHSAVFNWMPRCKTGSTISGLQNKYPSRNMPY